MIYHFLLDLTGSQVIAAFINATFPLLFIIPFALFAVLAERKIAGFMQDRIGPNRVGYRGVLQTVADILKLIQKEDIIARDADKPLFIAAPYLVFAASYAAFAAIPFSSAYMGSGLDLGVLFILAISGFAVPGILLAGWASNNKYSLLGAMRAAAQIISYEIPTILMVLSIVAVSQSFNLMEVSEQQTSWFYNWYIFGGPDLSWQKFVLIPFMIISLLILFISTLAEVNRTPFDIPEAESELVAGFHTEYTGMKFAMFFLSEYANMFAVSAIISSLFLGGYQSPFGYIGNTIGLSWLVPMEQFAWFTIKGLLLVFVQMWLRWTLPRLRVDQLMIVCWKYLIPIAFVVFIIVSLITVL